MELLIEETVEPSAVQPPVRHAVRATGISAQPSVLKRLEQSRGGRAVLGFMRWGIVCGLVLTGFFGAEIVSAGVDSISRNVATGPSSTGQPILAAAGTQQQ